MQESIELTLPITNKPVIIRGYMTGYIDQQIETVTAGARKQSFTVTPEQAKEAIANNSDPTPSMTFEIDPAAQILATNKKLELMVTALDGNTGDILNRVLELPKQDVKFILDEIAKVEGESKVEGSDPKAPNA
jgi:hypothetical protein